MVEQHQCSGIEVDKNALIFWQTSLRVLTLHASFVVNMITSMRVHIILYSMDIRDREEGKEVRNIIFFFRIWEDQPSNCC